MQTKGDKIQRRYKMLDQKIKKLQKFNDNI